MPLTNPQAADHLAAAAGSFEPQRQNNFSIEIPLDAGDRDIIVMSLASFSLPGESNDEVEIDYQNEKRYVAGKATFDTASLSVVDYVDQETRNAIMRWRQQVYDKETGQVGLAANYKKNCDVILMGPDGSQTRVCHLKGCWPQSVTPGSFDMSASDKVMIEVTLRVDKCVWDNGL